MRALNAIVRFASVVMLPLGIGLYLASRADGVGFSASVLTTVGALLGMIPQGLVLLTSSVLCLAPFAWRARRCSPSSSTASRRLRAWTCCAWTKPAPSPPGAWRWPAPPARGRGGLPSSTRCWRASPRQPRTTPTRPAAPCSTTSAWGCPHSRRSRRALAAPRAQRAPRPRLRASRRGSPCAWCRSPRPRVERRRFRRAGRLRHGRGAVRARAAGF